MTKLEATCSFFNLPYALSPMASSSSGNQSPLSNCIWSRSPDKSPMPNCFRSKSQDMTNEKPTSIQVVQVQVQDDQHPKKDVDDREELPTAVAGAAVCFTCPHPHVPHPHLPHPHFPLHFPHLPHHTPYSLIPKHKSIIKKLAAEFVATFIFVTSVTIGPIINEGVEPEDALLRGAIGAGLTVMILVYAIGHVSGAHISPAVTVSLAVFRYFPWPDAVAYVLVQLTASIAASFTLKSIFHPFFTGGVTAPSTQNSVGQIFFLEFIVSFLLLFVVTTFAAGNRPISPTMQDLGPLPIGATIAVDVLIAGPRTGASMNPARTLGPAIAAGNYKLVWVYLFAPLVGGIAGAGVNTLLW